MVLGRLSVRGRLVRPGGARLLHVSAVCLAFTPIQQLRTTVTPVVGYCASANGEHIASSPPELYRKASAKVLPKLSHPDQPAWTEAIGIGAAEEFAARVGYPAFVRPSYAFKVSGPHNMQVTRNMVLKTSLNSSLPRPPITPSTNSYLLQGLARVSPRPSFASFPRRPLFPSRSFHQPGPRADRDRKPEEKTKPSVNEELRGVKGEKIWTIPNILTASRVLSCPVLGYAILHDNFYVATGLLVYAGLTDFADGYLARKYNMGSVLGSILDPAADKALVTTLVVTLTVRGLVPLPLGIIILGRDVLLSLSAFWIRWRTLPPPKTFQRYWDFSLPSAEVRPTLISKVNTALQLLLMGVTTVSPILTADISLPLQALQWTVAGTTIWSGLSYLFGRGGFRVIKPPTKGI